MHPSDDCHAVLRSSLGINHPQIFIPHTRLKSAASLRPAAWTLNQLTEAGWCPQRPHISQMQPSESSQSADACWLVAAALPEADDPSEGCLGACTSSEDSKGHTSVVGDMRPVCDDDRAVMGGSRPPGDSSTLLGMLLVTDGGVAPLAPIDPAGPAPDSMVSAYSQLGSQHSTGQIPESATQYYCARMP